MAIVRATDVRFKPRGKLIGDFDSNVERIAQMRLELDSMRLVVMNAADSMDQFGNKDAKYVIAMSKILVPNTVERIVNECCQLYGGQGLTQHTPLPEIWTYARWARVADGPDSVHRHQVGRNVLKKGKEIAERHQEYNRKAKQYTEQAGEKFLMMPEDSL